MFNMYRITYCNFYSNNYKFNGKELDDELRSNREYLIKLEYKNEQTGFYYYGARYYTPELSIWLSVDPLSDERSWLSPYNYCQWNPVKRIDPDGALDDYYLNLETGNVEHHEGSISRFDQGLVHLAGDNATVGDIEDALTQKNYTYQKDPTVPGGFHVDTEKQYKGWAMMQIFSPEIVGTILFMSLGTGGSSSAGKATSSAIANTTRSTTSSFRSFSSSNFRYNLSQLTGKAPSNSHAHHVFPKQFASKFEKIGININDPKYGVWWNASSHLKNAKTYNAAWDAYFKTNPSQSQVLEFGRQLMGRYGIPVAF